LASAQKLLPMMGGAAAGMTFEFELEDSTQACLGGANKSQSWEISSFQCHIDSVQLTSELTTSFADMLQRGESILIPYVANLWNATMSLKTASPSMSLNTATFFFEKLHLEQKNTKKRNTEHYASKTKILRL
jgi:hypothetical protein